MLLIYSFTLLHELSYGPCTIIVVFAIDNNWTVRDGTKQVIERYQIEGRPSSVFHRRKKENHRYHTSISFTNFSMQSSLYSPSNCRVDRPGTRRKNWKVRTVLNQVTSY